MTHVTIPFADTATPLNTLPSDTSKYIIQTNGQLVIPASEAASFIAHYKPEDKLPVRVEGYAWYCDDCYTDQTTMNKGGKGKNVEGEFNHKRTMEKHFADRHKTKWEPMLPEPRRGMLMCPNGVVSS